MEETLLTWLASDNGQAVYIAVIVALLLGAFGFPIPEDIPIFLAGVAASKEIVRVETIFLTCYFGVIIADLILYGIGYYFGNRILQAGTRAPWLSYLTHDRVDKARTALRKNRILFVFIARHLFPIRTATFVTAGALHVPLVEFILADAVAALISISLIGGLGYFLGERITAESLNHFIEHWSPYVVLALIMAFLAWYINRRARKARLRKMNEDDPRNHVSSSDTL